VAIAVSHLVSMKDRGEYQGMLSGAIGMGSSTNLSLRRVCCELAVRDGNGFSGSLQFSRQPAWW
jgi:hypothetical protein